MKKKFTYFVAAVCAALTFSACSSDKLEAYSGQTLENPESPSNAISFGTYMGRQNVTRAQNGSGGSIASTSTTDAIYELANKGGFGVFAYYTGGATYGQHQTGYSDTYSGSAGITEKYPNFMYNQLVSGTKNESATPKTVTGWTYFPLKYWPNDFAGKNSAVDNKSATGSDEYGGNVSFFAYAPYVTYASVSGGTVGITGMSANNNAGDPTITYIITDGTLVSDVDLLWGTHSGTSANVLGTAQSGVTGSSSGTDGSYIKAILNNYTVNADLTKQKVGGQVGFAFKHALAGLGGGSKASSSSGFQVVLDINNSTTGITGGSRETFNESTTNYYRTIVTVKNIEITNDLNDNGSIDNDEKTVLGGTLNLATGQWTLSEASATKYSHTIGIGDSYTAALSPKIAEYSTGTTSYISAHSSDYKGYFEKDTYAKVNDGTHPGVTETAQNVYNLENQSPIMFIPGTTPKVRVTVDYIVRTYDANLISTKPYTEVEQKISKTITFPAVELNKHYNLLMHLGLTDVKFTATVNNWDENHIGTAGGGTSADSDDIYLPINVSE